MSDVPTDMKAELGAWNNGSGIDLETWISCMGGFQLAVGYTTIFWPHFRLIDDMILRDNFTEQSLADWKVSCAENLAGIESVINHIHLKDIHYYDCPDVSADRLQFLGRILKNIYQAKLAWEFPDRPCVVDFYEPENRNDLQEYQITFWQAKHEKGKAQPGAAANASRR